MADEIEDARIDYISNITKMILNIDPKLWGDLIWKEENQLIIKDFLDTPATKLLVLYVDTKGKLVVTIEFPSYRPMPKKTIYFLKYAEISIPMTNFRPEIMHGNMSNTPLKLFQAIYEKVMAPIFCSPENNKKWPVEVVDDIVLHVQDFRKVLYYSLGQAQGKTLLPIPETAKKLELLDIESFNSLDTRDPQIRSVLDSIGTMVVDWTTVVNEVLSVDMELALSKAEKQGPMTEIAYWKNRKVNLEFIFSQIDDPTVKKMAVALEKTNSCYLEAFKKLLRDIVEALAEADDIANHLETLTDQFEQLISCEFTELAGILPEVMEKITSSWAASKYFSSTPSKICILVQKMCNLLTQRVQDYLLPKQLFNEERAASQEKVVFAKKILDQFVESYYECRNNMESTFQYEKLYPWEFPDGRVFKRFKDFVQRLDDFQGFEEHYRLFNLKLRDLDCRLGAAINQGCASCSPTEDAFKLMQSLKCLVERPMVNVEFKSCVTCLIGNVNAELLLARQMYDEQMKSIAENGQCIAYKNMPPVSGALRWSCELQKRILSPITSLQNMEKYFVTSTDAQLAYHMHAELVDLLKKFENNVFIEWSNSVDVIISQKLEHPLLIKDSEKNVIQLNFDLQISEIVEEVKNLEQLEKEIPNGAVELNKKSEDLHFARSVLFSTVGWYNQLSDDLVPFEKVLISEQWEEINSLLEKGQVENWAMSGKPKVI